MECKTTPYHECPSFEVCSCNVCPLDPDADSKERLPGEELCRAYKSTRQRIGCTYSQLLPRGGLTKREWVGQLRWARMTEAQKDAQRAITAAAYAKRQKMQKKAIVEAVVNDYGIA